MKYIKLLGIIVVIIGVVVVGIILVNRKTKPTIKIEKIDSFYFSSGSTMLAYGNASYEYRCGEKCLIGIKPSGVPEEEIKQYEVDDEFRDKLEEILNKYKVNTWDGFHKSDPNVLDGSSFNMTIKLQKGSISASGYMKWPKNYRETRDEIEELFNSYAGKEVEE